MFFEKNGFESIKKESAEHKSNVNQELKKLEKQTSKMKKNAAGTVNEMIYRKRLDIMPDSMILTAGPSICQYESYYAYDAATNGWNSSWNKYLCLLESKFKDYIGVKYALATSSCTGAMHIALLALEIGEGDEVIVPDMTWIGSVTPISWLGAKPVFVDILEDSLCIDYSKIEQAITKNTKAIIVVHPYGNVANMDEILLIGKKYKTFFIKIFKQNCSYSNRIIRSCKTHCRWLYDISLHSL